MIFQEIGVGELKEYQMKGYLYSHSFTGGYWVYKIIK